MKLPDIQHLTGLSPGGMRYYDPRTASSSGSGLGAGLRESIGKIGEAVSGVIEDTEKIQTKIETDKYQSEMNLREEQFIQNNIEKKVYTFEELPPDVAATIDPAQYPDGRIPAYEVQPKMYRDMLQTNHELLVGGITNTRWRMAVETDARSRISEKYTVALGEATKQQKAYLAEEEKLTRDRLQHESKWEERATQIQNSQSLTPAVKAALLFDNQNQQEFETYSNMIDYAESTSEINGLLELAAGLKNETLGLALSNGERSQLFGSAKRKVNQLQEAERARHARVVAQVNKDNKSYFAMAKGGSRIEPEITAQRRAANAAVGNWAAIKRIDAMAEDVEERLVAKHTPTRLLKAERSALSRKELTYGLDAEQIKRKGLIDDAIDEREGYFEKNDVFQMGIDEGVIVERPLIEQGPRGLKPVKDLVDVLSYNWDMAREYAETVNLPVLPLSQDQIDEVMSYTTMGGDAAVKEIVGALYQVMGDDAGRVYREMSQKGAPAFAFQGRMARAGNTTADKMAQTGREYITKSPDHAKVMTKYRNELEGSMQAVMGTSYMQSNDPFLRSSMEQGIWDVFSNIMYTQGDSVTPEEGLERAANLVTQGVQRYGNQAIESPQPGTPEDYYEKVFTESTPDMIPELTLDKEIFLKNLRQQDYRLISYDSGLVGFINIKTGEEVHLANTKIPYKMDLQEGLVSLQEQTDRYNIEYRSDKLMREDFRYKLLGMTMEEIETSGYTMTDFAHSIGEQGMIDMMKAGGDLGTYLYKGLMTTADKTINAGKAAPDWMSDQMLELISPPTDKKRSASFF